nr:MAG TPA: hypothetical protein [Caudoviricetes sp.]
MRSNPPFINLSLCKSIGFIGEFGIAYCGSSNFLLGKDCPEDNKSPILTFCNWSFAAFFETYPIAFFPAHFKPLVNKLPAPSPIVAWSVKVRNPFRLRKPSSVFLSCIY